MLKSYILPHRSFDLSWSNSIFSHNYRIFLQFPCIFMPRRGLGYVSRGELFRDFQFYSLIHVNMVLFLGHQCKTCLLKACCSSTIEELTSSDHLLVQLCIFSPCRTWCKMWSMQVIFHFLGVAVKELIFRCSMPTLAQPAHSSGVNRWQGLILCFGFVPSNSTKAYPDTLTGTNR